MQMDYLKKQIENEQVNLDDTPDLKKIGEKKMLHGMISS